MPKQSKNQQPVTLQEPARTAPAPVKATRKAARSVEVKQPQPEKASRAVPTVAAKPKAKAEKSPAKSARSANKIDQLIELMRAKKGASIEQLSRASGWQNHSVRGAISGAIKKKLGLKVTSERIDGVRIYRIAK